MNGSGSAWGLRLVALAIAVVVWAFVTLDRAGERPAEKFVDATVSYNPPPGVVILNPVDRVRVQVRGSERDIRHVNPFSIDVQVSFPRQGRGTVDVHLGPENVLTPEGVEVTSIEPSFLRLEVDAEIRRLLPVRVVLNGEPAAGAVPGTPRVRPDSLLVSGPESLLSRLSHLETSPVSLNGHALDFEESAIVTTPDPLVKVLQSPVVVVTIPMRQPQPPGEGVSPARGAGP